MTVQHSRNRRGVITSRLRLRDHDYSEPGIYFFTICVADRICRFGRITGDVFVPNDAGEMVTRRWMEIPDRFPDAHLDSYCLMPNHFHGLLILGSDPVRAVHVKQSSAIQVMQWFKSVSTVDYIHGVKARDWKPFSRHLWQVGYHDHIVRGEHDLGWIRTYIANNPSNWRQDVFWEEAHAVFDKEG